MAENNMPGPDRYPVRVLIGQGILCQHQYGMGCFIFDMQGFAMGQRGRHRVSFSECWSGGQGIGQ